MTKVQHPSYKFTIGIFYCEFVGETPSGLRWKMTNTFNNIFHFTYGKMAEVVESAEAQTAAWQRRNVELKKQGGAWRMTNFEKVKKEKINGVAEAKVPQNGVGAGEAYERLAEPNLRSA